MERTAEDPAGEDRAGAVAPERYPKIAERFAGAALPGGEWIAEEKVHGANVSLCADGHRVRAASRRGVLTDDRLDDFFGLARIWPVLAAAAGTIARELAARTRGFEHVVLYGELAGGSYPHPDVPPEPGLTPVQTGVWYDPGLLWLGFDALVRTRDAVVWLGRDELAGLLTAAGLRPVPLIGRGRRAELAALPVEFPTRVPVAPRRPVIAGNLAEGLVLKPAVRWDVTARGPRPVRKLKTRAFAEDARYEGARPYVVPPGGAAGVPAWLLAAAVERLTPPRVGAARGKLGPRADGDALVAEVLEDTLADLAEAVGGLDAADLDRLRDVLRPGAEVLVAAG